MTVSWGLSQSQGGGVGLTMLLLLRQTLFCNLDISFSGLESFYPSLGVMNRSGRGPDVEELRGC